MVHLKLNITDGELKSDVNLLQKDFLQNYELSGYSFKIVTMKSQRISDANRCIYFSQ